MPSTPEFLRARAVHATAAQLEFSNVTAAVVDRTEDDPQPDIATPAAFVAVEYGTLAAIPKRVREATARARAANDFRPVVVAYGFESVESRADALAVLSVHDLARLLGALEDSEAVSAA